MAFSIGKKLSLCYLCLVMIFLLAFFILMWQKTPCLYRREMNATSAEFTQVIEVDNRT